MSALTHTFLIYSAALCSQQQCFFFVVVAPFQLNFVFLCVFFFLQSLFRFLLCCSSFFRRLYLPIPCAPFEKCFTSLIYCFRFLYSQWKVMKIIFMISTVEISFFFRSFSIYFFGAPPPSLLLLRLLCAIKLWNEKKTPPKKNSVST